MPLPQAVHAGLCGAAAKLPGMHIWQLAASVLVLAQPAGQVLHHGCCEGATGQPVHAAQNRAFLSEMQGLLPLEAS